MKNIPIPSKQQYLKQLISSSTFNDLHFYIIYIYIYTYIIDHQKQQSIKSEDYLKGSQENFCR